MDIATLGYAVDTTSLRAGTTALDEHERAADKVARTAGRVGQSSQALRAENSRGADALSRITSAASIAGGEYESLAYRATMVASAISTTGVALGGAAIAGTVVAAGLVKSIALYRELETTQRQTTAALQVTANASGQTAGSLADMANALARSGPQSVEEIRSIQNEVLKLRGISGDVFPRVLQLAQQLSQTGFADMRGAASALAQAVDQLSEDSLANLEAVLGIRLSQSVRQSIEDLRAHGRTLEAQDLLLKSVADRSQDLGKNIDPLTESYRRLAVATRQEAEATGQWVNDLGRAIAEALRLKGVMDWISESMERDAAKPRNTASGGDLAAQAGINDIEGAARAIAARQAEAEAAARKADAVKKAVGALDEELQALRRGEVEQRVYNEAKRLGVLGDEKAVAAIRAKVAAIDAEREAQGNAEMVRRISSIGENRTKMLEQQIELYGKSAGAIAEAQFRTELLNIANLRGITIDENMQRQIDGMAQRYGELAERLARLTEAKQAADAISSGLADEFVNVTTKTKMLSQAVLDLSNSFYKMFVQMALSGQGPLAGLFGTSQTGGLLGGLLRGAFGGIGTPTAHAGWLVGAPNPNSIVVPSHLVAGAPRFHSGSSGPLAADERLAVLQTGEEVRSRNQVAADRRAKSDERSVRVYAPVTVIAPEPAKFTQSRGQVSRTVSQAWQRARRFS